MEGGRVFDNCSHMNSVLLKSERLPCSSEVLDSLWIPSSSTAFHGSSAMVNFEDVKGDNTTERPFFTQMEMEKDNSNEDYDGCFHQPEKKRRLTADQVHFLERSFEVENKLEPERKVQLAKELGLQPRQVAIWFQNRRARYKTKQLEKEYDSLKASYDKLKADYEGLSKENEKLKNEVQSLTEKLQSREKGKRKSEQPSIPTTPLEAEEPKKPSFSPVSPNASNAAMAVYKQEDASSASAKSDVFDSDSPHYTDGNHSSFLEPADSSHVFEPELSDFSQDEDDSLRRRLLPPLCFPKLEDECYGDLQDNSCNLGFPVEDQATWFWAY